MKQIKVAIIGVGQRGEGYANYIAHNPYEAQIVAVAELNSTRREQFCQKYHLSAEQCFTTWQEMLSVSIAADAILVCTQDRQHFEPAMAALNAGYHVLLEKPMSPDP